MKNILRASPQTAIAAILMMWIGQTACLGAGETLKLAFKNAGEEFKLPAMWPFLLSRCTNNVGNSILCLLRLT